MSWLIITKVKFLFSSYTESVLVTYSAKLFHMFSVWPVRSKFDW